MNNKKYYFDMKSQNFNAVNNTNYLEHLDDDRETMLETIFDLYSNKPEHIIDVLIPILYSYCIHMSMHLDLRSSIEFFNDFRKTLNDEMKGFITFLQIREDVKEARRHGKEES